VQSLKKHLSYINSPERLAIGHGHYLIGGFKYGAEGIYLGADGTMWWYNRNLRIFSNLLQLIDYQEERIFLMIGAGHVPIIKHVAESTPEIQYMNIEKYLKK
jgi:hypothetical protein